MALPTLIRDTREKPDHGWKWNKTKQITGTEIATLKYGDYSIAGLEHVVAIERKGGASEFLNNILTADSERFKRELEVLSKFEYAYIICEFDMRDIRSAIKYIPYHKRKYFTVDKILGAIASLTVKYKIPILFTGKPRTIRQRNGTSKTVNLGKDLAKKLLLKAHKYYGKHNS
jgi:ERCC4-type nuclease